MDALTDLACSGRPTTIAGKTFHLMPLLVRHYAEAAEIIRSKKPKPLDAVASLMPTIQSLAPEDRQYAIKQLLAMAYDDERNGSMIALVEVQSWHRTHEGLVHRLFCQIRQKHPDVTQEYVEQLLQVDQDQQDKKADAMAKLGRLDQLQNELAELSQDLDGMPRGN